MRIFAYNDPKNWGKWLCETIAERRGCASLFKEAEEVPNSKDVVVYIPMSHQFKHRAKHKRIAEESDKKKNILMIPRFHECCMYDDKIKQAQIFWKWMRCTDIIYSPTEAEIITSLTELCRVLRPGGGLIVTLDNSSNITYPPYFIMKLWMRLGLAPYIIGRTIPITRLTQVLDEIGFDVEEQTAIFHYIHPDVLIRWLEISLRWLSRGKLENMIMKCLCLLDRLEKKRTRFLTGRYIAVKAVKRSSFDQSAL